jgi:hypothetical protein
LLALPSKAADPRIWFQAMRRSAYSRPKPTRCGALELLAASPRGCTEAIMRAHGFTVDMLAKIVLAGLATVTTERVVAGRKTIEVTRVRITAAGRQALRG